jgi:Fic family protein
MSVAPTPVNVYDQPHQFEPLVPQSDLAELVRRTRGMVEASFRLQSVHPATRASLRELVRAMNSYYSNLIEGQSTHPANIARALKKDFSDKPDTAQRQRIAIAHIDAERELEAAHASDAEALTSRFLQRAHASLYGRLAPADRMSPNGRVVEPGVLRQEDVTVGRHHPPGYASVPAFLARADDVYGRVAGLDTLLYTIAAAHHRYAWVHPFLDGNGRACRLQTHCALLPLSDGLWSVNRGLARQRARYYELLANADMPRHGDLDGRGNLSEKMLRAWCEFFIEVCEDQVQFMGQMLDLEDLKKRIAALVSVRGETVSSLVYRREIVLPLHHIVVAGPVSRGEFTQMTGLGERTVRDVTRGLLKDGLLTSDSHRGLLSIAFPLDALNLLFPRLYPEAAGAPPED